MTAIDKNYAVTIRLNVEMDVPVGQVKHEVLDWVLSELPHSWRPAGPTSTSVTAYEDVLIKDRAA